ncbi:hypothetical protein [Planctomycetes bacterium K23_9]|uniref:hypothetical protein n=1 Tax=Stieleria marina TaxID=1930275 RepID=UPI0011A17E58
MSHFHSVCGLIRSWAGRDRIRISPTQGRLLGLRPSDRLLIGQAVFTVQSREVNRQTVVYQLVDDGSACQVTDYQMTDNESTDYQLTGFQLTVPINTESVGAQRQAGRGELNCRGECRDVFEEDVCQLSQTKADR